MLSASTKIALSTCRLECSGLAGRSTGTGSLFRFAVSSDPDGPVVLGIVTNKHVIKDVSYLDVNLSTIAQGDQKLMTDDFRGVDVVHQPIRLTDVVGRTVLHPDRNVDLCFIWITDVVSEIAQKRTLRHLFLDESFFPDSEMKAILRPIERIVMIGYPHGLWDQTNNLPIIRSGLTASHPLISWNGNCYFVIDAACFPGSSGSPVFLFEDGMFRSSLDSYSPGTRVALLGYLWGGPTFSIEGEMEPRPVPTNLTGVPVVKSMMNLGFVIHAEQLWPIRDIVIRMHQRIPGKIK